MAVLLVLAAVGLVVPRIVTDAAHSRPIVLDGGALTISPIAPDRPPVSESQAKNTARMVFAQVSGPDVAWVYARVSAAASGTQSGEVPSD